MSHAYSPSNPFQAAFDPTRCAYRVADGGRSVAFHQCSRTWTFEEEGHRWCKQHAPSEERKRFEASVARDRAKQALLEKNSAWYRLAKLREAAGTNDLDELMLLVLAGRRWMADHGKCPLHGLKDTSHICRDYDGEGFGPDGYRPQGYAAAKPFFNVTEAECAATGQEQRVYP